MVDSIGDWRAAVIDVGQLLVAAAYILSLPLSSPPPGRWRILSLRRIKDKKEKKECRRERKSMSAEEIVMRNRK
jgi:hypothetical protein